MKKYVKLLEKNGFVLIPNLLSEKKCEIFKEMLNKSYEKYAPKYANNNNNNNLAKKTHEKVVFNLHNKNLKWFELFENKRILGILDVVLKKGSYQNNEPYYLNNISARCPLNGNPGQDIHLDSNLPGVNYNIITNVIWYFDNVNIKNGTTILIRNSHKFKKYANNSKKIKNKIYINAKKGSVLVFNANMWHGGSKKNNNDSRWALVLGYARWFIKPSFDYMFNTPKKIYKKMTNKQKSLLGFYHVPPKDEFTRLNRRSIKAEIPFDYNLI